ncbi:MAG: hypothetical protein QM831_06685 [Kofleriaceae bacterium]
MITSRAAAHVAPSVDDNNRYLKVTPFGDRVRIAYTVFFGEVPGAIQRREMDANHDGQVSEPEAQQLGEKLAEDVRAGLELEVDGVVSPFIWSNVEVGLGTNAVAAGSFSIDLVASGCFTTARGHHTIRLHDRFRMPHPGETEIKIEDGMGIAIAKAHVGPADDPTHDYKFAGPGGPLTDDGLELIIDAGPKSTVTPDATCSAAPARRSHVLVYVAIGCALAVLGAVALVLRRRT